MVMYGRARARFAGVWWAALLVVLFGGVIWLVAVLRPVGKSDPKAAPVALYGLVVGVGGSALVAWRTENRPVRIDLDQGRIRLGRFGAVAPNAVGIRVGEWRQPWTGAVLGGILWLPVNGRTVRVGGSGWTAKYQAAAWYTGRSHITLSERDFGRLLDILRGADDGFVD